MSHIWMSHVIDWPCLAMRPLCHPLHVTHKNESCHSYEWVTSHDVYPTTHPYVCTTTQFYSWHAGHHTVERLECCDMTHSHVWHDSLTLDIQWLITTRGGDRLKRITTAKISNQFSWESPYKSNKFSRESSEFQTSLLGSKRKSPSLKRKTEKTVESGNPNILSRISSLSGLSVQYESVLFLTCWQGRSGGTGMVWHDPFICETWLILMCDMPHPHVCNMTQFYSCREGQSRAIGMLWHDPLTCVTWLINVVYPTTHHHARRRSDLT